jgi:hypothetical protein
MMPVDAQQVISELATTIARQAVENATLRSIIAAQEQKIAELLQPNQEKKEVGDEAE